MGGKWVHRLTDVDLEAKTAVCAVDGPVDLFVSGKTRRCRKAIVLSDDERTQRVQEVRPGQHRMLSKDLESKTGTCALCGFVKITKTGKGFRCMNSRQKPEQLRMRDEFKRAIREGKNCEICGGPGQVLDHKHGTSTWRGVLCYKHNAGLGMFNDSPELLMSAIEYLQKQT